MIAKPAIALLDELLLGSRTVELFATPVAPDGEPGDAPRLSLGDCANEKERLLQELNDQLEEHELPADGIGFELTDPRPGRPLAILDVEAAKRYAEAQILAVAGASDVA